MNKAALRASCAAIYWLSTQPLAAQAVAVDAAAPPPTAAASETDPTDIIVTARRVEERLQDVPISITAFSQQQLNQRNIVSSGDLAAYTPSLSTNTFYGGDNANFAIRGFVQEGLTSPSVGVYFADVVAPRGSSPTFQTGDGAGPGNFFDLQNIQVLKGPQGTLFGRNTTGGAILFVPQKPTSRLEGYAEASIGNYDLRRLQAAINLPLGDRARLRLAGDHQDRDGYQRNITGIGPRRFADIGFTSLRASLVLDLTPDLENYTIASYTRSRNNGSRLKVFACNTAPPANQAFTAGLGCGQIAAQAGRSFYTVQNDLPDPGSQLDQWQVINTTTWRASDALTIKNIASYAELKDNLRTNLLGTNFALAPGLGIPIASIGPARDFDISHEATYTEELQFQGKGFDDRLSWQAGLYYEKSSPLGRSGNITNTLLTCENGVSFNCVDYLGLFSGQPVGSIGLVATRTSLTTAAVYGQASYDLTDRLKLTGGIRYTWNRTRAIVTNGFYNYPTPGVPQAQCANSIVNPPGVVVDSVDLSCTDTFRQKSDAPTWLIDLDYKPIDTVLLYAKYARAYRTGGIAPTGATGFNAFGQEKADAYEIGAKTELRGPVRGTFNVAGFYNKLSNQQIQVTFQDVGNVDTGRGTQITPVPGIVNAGASRIYGAEVEGSLELFRGFRVDGGYTYLRTKVRSLSLPTLLPSCFDNGFATPCGLYNNVLPTAVAGGPLSFSPRHKFTVTAGYTLPLAEATGDVRIAATYTYTAKQLVTVEENDLGSIQPIKLLNANLDWTDIMDTPVSLSLFVTNLLKRKYYTTVSGAYQALGFEIAQIGEPRMYGLRLRYRFGR